MPDRASIRAGAASKRAHSLVEVVIVTAILGLIAGIAVPRFADASSRSRARAAAERVALDLRQAMTISRTEALSRRVNFDMGKDFLMIEDVSDMNDSDEVYTTFLGDAPYRADLRWAYFDGSNHVMIDGFGVPAFPGAVVVSAGEARLAVLMHADGSLEFRRLSQAELDGLLNNSGADIFPLGTPL